MGYAEWFQPVSCPSHSSCSSPLMTWPHKNHCTPFRKSAKSKEMKAPSALPVSHHDGKDTSRNRPTQGWTVDEANLLCKVIYILWPSSLGLDGEYILHPSPRRPNKACTWDICFPLANIKHSTQTFFAFLFYPNPQDCSKHKKRMVTYHDSATSNYAEFITSALKSPTKSTTTQQEIPQQ